MNRRAFTLIELIAVITIMGIILLIAAPEVNKVYTDSRETTCVNFRDVVVKAATTYAEYYRKEDNPLKISISDLKNAGFINSYPSRVEIDYNQEIYIKRNNFGGYSVDDFKLTCKYDEKYHNCDENYCYEKE